MNLMINLTTNHYKITYLKDFQNNKKKSIDCQIYFISQQSVFIYYITSMLKHIKLLTILSIILLCAHSHIYSSDTKVTYDFNGNPLTYHIFLSLDTGIGADDYLMIDWPLRIHSGTDKSVVKVKLISFSNNLEIVSTACKNYPTGSTTTQYYVTFGVALTASKWYEIQLFPDVIPGSLTPAVSLPFYGLIRIQALSDIVANPITYDSNYAFAYISIQSNLASQLTMAVATTTTSSSVNTVAAIYTINIDVTPSITSSVGGNFTLKIHYDSSNSNHNSGTGQLDFTFMGLCHSVTPATGSAAVLNNCQISSDLSSIYFSVNSITATQPIRIQTQVSNPLFVSKRGIRAYYVDFISGIVKQNGYMALALIVNPIPIQDLGNQRVYLFWGISTENTDPQLSSLSLGLYKATGSNVGPFNSFNAGFSFLETSPIDGRYTVKMYLGATGFLEGSVAHNLPAYTGLKVFCDYDTTSKYLLCHDVGPFININYRYFISGKAFYNSASGSSVSGFGNVQILPVVYDGSGNQLTVALYTALSSGDTISLIDSQQYLDTSGYHNPGSYKIGVAKIVSYYDDGTLSSTANAMNGFLRGTNSTVGIVPDLGVSQQLLLLMKVGSVAGGSGSGNQFKMRLLYNNKVIGFETGGESRGLDFVGYDSANSVWSISYSPCHITNNVVCQKYNIDTPTKNIQVINNATTNNYGLYKFDCGGAYTATPSCFNGDCATACNMFTGYGTSNYNAGVMALRKVTFPSTSFHSSLYADSNLMDFLVVFLQGSGFVAASLINAYTMVGTDMQNIKASYVNYFDYDSTNYNKGERIPTMIRISGGVLPSQSRNATVVGVFFDDNIDAETFYTYKNTAYDVGCSTGSCLYYPNPGINLPPNDIWHTMRRVQFYNLPPIQNQFNLLVPVTPLPSRYTYDSDPLPDTLTIAFFTNDYSVGDATGLLKTVSVYRLFGTVVTGAVTGAISNINGLARRGSNYFSTYFSNNYPPSYSGTGLSYYLNTSNINSNPPNNTFAYGYSGTFTFNNQYGCGVTLTSLYYNIFSSSTVAFESPPANTATTCTIFGYVYNEQTAGQNLDRNGQWIYTAFCPIDSTLNMNGPDGNIRFMNPQYPNVFTTNYHLRSVLTYGISDPAGQLVHFKHETSAISGFVRTCTTAKLQSYNPSSSGKQRATFTVSTPQIRMAAASKYDGHSLFNVYIVLPSMSNINMLTGCSISDPMLSCTATGGSSSTTVTVNYIGTGVMTVTYFQLQLYASTSGVLGSGGDYSLTIYLPQQGSTYVNFGTAFGYQSTFCTCSSNFKIGNTAYGTGMVFETPIFTSKQLAAQSYYQFNFGSYDYREAFFSTSVYRFGFGFMTQPSSTDRTASNFRCMVYENNQGALQLSSKFSQLTFSSFSAVDLSPKTTIDEPKNYLFTMACYGSGVTSGANTTPMTLAWVDSSTNVQTATNIAYVSSNYVAAAPSTLSVVRTHKRFNTEGMKGFYSFSLTSSQALTESTRIYFNFHFQVSSKYDNEGYVECYLRTTSTLDVTTDPTAKFTYCTFNQDRQLVIWNNLAVAASTTIYIDIYNIQIPKAGTTNPNGITISLDSDSDYSNGVAQKVTLTDSVSGSNSVSDIIITSTSALPALIRNPQDIIIKFNTVATNVIVSGSFLYLLLPGPYGEWISRGQTLTLTNCKLQADSSIGTNRISACNFISKRVLKLTISSTTSQSSHTLTLSGIYAPSKVPDGRYNQYRFKLFMSSSAAEGDINRFSFTDYTKYLTLSPDPNLIDLSWKYYGISVSDSLVSLTDQSSQTYIIYIGYYSNVIELRQSIYPSNFILQMSVAISNQVAGSFLHKDGTNIKLGYQNTYLRLAASTSVQAGLFTLQYSKTGDTNNKYTAVPPLTIVVSNTKCKLQTRETSYSMPRGGLSVPIHINGISCIPLTSITITPTFSSSQIVMETSLSSTVLSPSVVDGQLYIVAKHNYISLPTGSLVTVTFAITGTQAAYFDTIPSISITIVDPAPFQTLPSATALSTPTLSYNRATFTLQCSMASRIYWGLGLYPSILNTQALDFEARIISGATGLLTNFTQPEDYYMKVYGMNYVTTTQTLSKTVYNLKSNSQYIFKYYCVNQMGLISDGQSIIFNSLNYGAYLMKVSIIFGGSITYQQYQDLACSLASNFQTPYTRIMTEAMSYCGSALTPFYTVTTDLISKSANTNGQYVYNFYILPDYTIPIDNTNANIRSALTLSSTSTTIITSTANVMSLPSLVQMQTQDIQFFAVPTMTISTPISGLSSIVVTGSITNMNGFIIVGCMDGVFNAATMTYPTATNIKKGLLSPSVNLLKVKMIYAIQNYNITFEFNGFADNTAYTCFYFATTQDPTISAQSTTVGSFTAQTLQALIVDINFSMSLNIIWGLLILTMLVFQ